MKNVIPVAKNIDSVVKANYSVVIKQDLVTRLQREITIYQGVFEIGMRPPNMPDIIDDNHLIVQGGSQSVSYATISWNMFGGYTGICRKDLLSDETFTAINKHLKKGQISFCTVYDTFVLWNLFRKKPIEVPHWIGIYPLKTNNFDSGIFMLENDDGNKTCLLFGDMYSAVTFSSRCQIFVRYKSFT